MKPNKQSLILLAPATLALFEGLYLPHFHRGQYILLIDYLEFRAYLFLMLFCIVGIATIFLIALYRSRSWFTAVLGIALCLIPLNLVYAWSVFPDSQLSSLFYVETEDYQFFYIPSDYAWIAILIGVLICFIGLIQGYISCTSTSNWRKLLHGAIDGGTLGAITVLPLPIWVYFFDRVDFHYHVTLNTLHNFTNADLLFTSIITLAACQALRLLLGERANQFRINQKSLSETATCLMSDQQQKND